MGIKKKTIKYSANDVSTQSRNGAQKKKKFGKSAKTVMLERFEENPIILPKAENSWESWQTFNPGVVLLRNKIHFLYRAIGEDGISRFGYAVSKDGFTVDKRLSSPVYKHKFTKYIFNYYSFASGGGFGGAEDPRIVRVREKDPSLYMTYVAFDEGLRVALTSIKVNDFLQKKWRWKKPILISPPGEVHKNWVIFPEKINGKYAILHSVNPEISISYRNSLEFQEGEYIHSYYNGTSRGKNCWHNWVRGAGNPPLKTRNGWLLFYHAMDHDWGKYKVGALLLDLNDPTKILYRSQEPVLEPEAEYENNGFKAGVVYVSGAVIRNRELLVYYGAADSFIGIAHAPLEKFLEGLTHETRPKLTMQRLHRKYAH